MRVKERLPDYVVTMADQIVNVDLSAEDLRERLQAGKIYPAERIQTAMENFFTPEKLTQLRELAMEEIAFRLDRSRREERAAERRDGLRLGAGHGLPELAEPARRRPAAQGGPDRRPPGRPLVRGLRADAARSPGEHRRRHAARRSATTWTWPGSWAARRLPFKGADLVSTIAAFVKEYGITHIVLGRSRQPWYRRWFGRSVLDRLLQTIPGVDVIVVDNSPRHNAKRQYSSRPREVRAKMQPHSSLTRSVEYVRTRNAENFMPSSSSLPSSGVPCAGVAARLRRPVQVIVVSSVMFTFISYWRTAAVVLCDLASTAYYIGGIVEGAIGPAAPWFILAVMLFSYAVRSIYIESCSLFVRGGVYRVVKEAMGGFLAKLSVSALMFDYILTGPDQRASRPASTSSAWCWTRVAIDQSRTCRSARTRPTSFAAGARW